MIRDRIELAEEFARRGFKKGAEIGTADGRYAEILCQKIPRLELFCVDPWAVYDGNWRSDDYQQQAYMKANTRLDKFEYTVLLRNTSLEASEIIRDVDLDFVFIDGAHDFDNVMLDIILWSRKVRKGGIVSGHDAYFFTKSGVFEAITDFCKHHKQELVITPRLKDGHIDDRAPIWYYEKR